MARTDNDTWDLASMVAAARAEAVGHIPNGVYVAAVTNPD
jgi:hypothetical protein